MMDGWPMDEWWKCCLNDGGRIHKGEIIGRSGWTHREAKKLPSQNIRPDQKSCDWSVTKCDFFVFQKYSGLPPFWTCDGNVAYCCVVGNRFSIQCPGPLGYTTGDEWPPLVAMVFYYYYFSIFEPNIFGWKVSVLMFSWFPTRTLWIIPEF